MTPSDHLASQVLQRADDDPKLDDATRELLLAALLDELDAALAALGDNGEKRHLARPTPTSTEEQATPAVAYVESVSVQGFRGIGENARLSLQPGPGLTLVVGRNGSGKSSFAEGLELLLTGDNPRWSSRKGKHWQDGWRNLHYTGGPSLEAQLLVEGQQGATVVRRQWSADATLDRFQSSVRCPSGELETVADLGWDAPLATFRPFLSYNELASMLDEGPSKLFDALSAILGLEDLVEAAERLKAARLQLEKLPKSVQKELAAVLPLLRELSEAELPDQRAVAALQALQGRKWQLDAVAAVLGDAPRGDDSDLELLRRLAGLEAPDPERVDTLLAEYRAATERFKALASTDAEQAHRLSVLLRQAIEHYVHRHPGGDTDGDSDRADCPVCGTAATLDGPWRNATEEQIARLEEEAASVREARSGLTSAEATLRDIPGPAPAILVAATEHQLIDPQALARVHEIWSEWHAVAAEHDLDADLDAAALDATVARHANQLARSLEQVVILARAAYRERQDAWRSVADRLHPWLANASQAEASKATVRTLKAAEGWLRECATALRNERFTPIKDQVQAHWNLLRTHSNVQLEDVRFRGKTTSRAVDIDITVDQTPGAALSVMSQGELNALALCLFLPRATMAESPFRFLFIDDPVQAMDPARVDGLARTLETVAQHRQVVVFTHDNRLPEAVRRLRIEATLLEVHRDPESRVTIERALAPPDRHLEDARALVLSDSIPHTVRDRVVPGICRLALEAACNESYRRRRLAAGARHRDIEEQLGCDAKLLDRLALALFDDRDRASDVLGKLDAAKKSYADVARACNKGAHGGAGGLGKSFVQDAQDLVQHIRKAVP